MHQRLRENNWGKNEHFSNHDMLQHALQNSQCDFSTCSVLFFTVLYNLKKYYALRPKFYSPTFARCTQQILNLVFKGIKIWISHATFLVQKLHYFSQTEKLNPCYNSILLKSQILQNRALPEERHQKTNPSSSYKKTQKRS